MLLGFGFMLMFVAIGLIGLSAISQHKTSQFVHFFPYLIAVAGFIVMALDTGSFNLPACSVVIAFMAAVQWFST